MGAFPIKPLYRTPLLRVKIEDVRVCINEQKTEYQTTRT